MPSQLKKFVVSAIVVLGFAGYALRGKLFAEGAEKGGIGGDDSTNVTANTTNTAATNIDTTNTPTNTSATGQYKDGSYTGPVADAFYGNIQVKAIVSGGKLTDVQFLQYPNDRPNSVAINQQAMPILRQEAISAQSANVDGASGASQTSQAFIQSLQGALSQAS